MKCNNIFLALLIIFSVAGQQVKADELDRSVRPEPGPAPSIELGEYETFELDNGLKVFVVENHKLPRVSFNLVLDIDPFIEGDIKGYRGITGDLLMTGTENRSRQEINQEIDFLGARVSTSSNGFFASSLSRNAEELLEVLSDITLNPVFDQGELERIKNRRKSNIAAELDEGSSIASKIRRSIYYQDHPYGEITTQETIENVTLQDCNNYYDTYFRPNIGYLAVVGDITKEEVRPMLEEYFGEWEESEVPTHEHDLPQAPDHNILAINDRSHAAQTVLNIGYPVELRPGDDDAIKASVMNTLLGGGFFRLNENLRETHAYTYGSYSRLTNDSEVGRFTASADVRTEVTDSAAYQILHEMRRLREEPVSERELQRVINYRSGSFAISLENPQTIARFALNIARYDLPEDYYENYMREIEAVTSEDIQEMAHKYIKPDNSYIVAVGVADKFTEGLSELAPEAEPRYFDREGNEIDPPREHDVPEGLTAQDVIDKYINAIGGRDKLEMINAMSTTTSATIQGMQIQVEEHKERPDRFFNEVKMGPQILNKRVLNGDKGFAVEGGGAMRELEGDDLLETRIEGNIIEEMYYEEYDVEMEFRGINEVDGEPAYTVSVTYPTGRNKSVYIDKNSHLKVQETTVMESPQGETTVTIRYLEYDEVEGIEKTGFFNRVRAFFGGDKKVEGVKLPSRMEQSIGPQSFELTVDERKVNHDIDPEIFSVEAD